MEARAKVEAQSAPIVRKDESGQVINGTIREVSGTVVLPPLPIRGESALGQFLAGADKLAQLMRGEPEPAQWSSCAVY